MIIIFENNKYNNIQKQKLQHIITIVIFKSKKYFQQLALQVFSRILYIKKKEKKQKQKQKTKYSLSFFFWKPKHSLVFSGNPNTSPTTISSLFLMPISFASLAPMRSFTN